MTYRVSNIGIWLDEDESLLGKRAAEKLGVDARSVGELRVVRKILDARKRNHPRFVYQVDVQVEQGPRMPRLGGDVMLAPEADKPLPPVRAPEQMPIIVGLGPAGLFCALGLLERGVRSILIDRGRPVQPRRRDVAKLFRDGTLDPDSNMNFGEGGAGAYTDGKLATRVSHPQVRKVVETFAHFASLDRILTEGKPHVGSDLLPGAISAFRAHLEEQGCKVMWETRVDDLLYRDGRCVGVKLRSGEKLESDRVILAPGNSARELYERFAADGKLELEPKPFAVGFRVEHPQSMIDKLQYGAACGNPKLPAADYKLAENPVVGGKPRGVYSFCMCPGGIVVPTPTEEGMQCTNGMSNSHRSAKFANAGIVAAVTLEDFAHEGFTGPLAGLQWQRKWEKAAFVLGGGGYMAPAMRVSDYLANARPSALGDTTYRPGLTPADVNQLFPEPVKVALKEALRGFDRKMRGFASGEGVLIGIEARTSAPLRITRGDDFQATALRGLYPVGEGCGYAGGIVSAAVDGLRAAEQICVELAA
ncbi:MAG: FAD-dependent oxidoreductase [Deltaproteobacteria bacterium]|nr:FAD-dependent oxidoreductase [Deltaproteobacteria bacterium]